MRSPTTATLLPSYVSGFVDEKQRPQSHLPSRPESARCRDSPAFWLVLYFCFNLGLTLYNKGILVRFPFPYTLSAIHALFGTVGALLLVARGAFVPTRPDSKQLVTIVAFSVLYTINIAVSNVSLELVTVPVRVFAFLSHLGALTREFAVPSGRPWHDPHVHSLVVRNAFWRAE